LNPHLLGEVIGSSLPLALIVFFASRKQFGAHGSRAFMPYLLAAAAGFMGFGAMIAFNTASRIVQRGVSATDIHELEDGFTGGCLRSCIAAGSSNDVCTPMCACVLTKLHTRYPTNEQFSSWFKHGSADLVRTKQEMNELGAACVQSSPAL
jgi:hypothetical protein